MPLLPYCIVSSDSQVVPPETAVRGAELQTLEESGLTCFYSELEAAPKTSEEIRADALAFQDTVQKIFAQATVIPFRFVTLVGDEEELHDFLEDHADDYLDALERLEGLVQFELRMKQTGAETDEPETGTAYLKAKQAANALVQKSSEALRKAAGTLARDWHVREGESVRCYALIARDAQDAFKKSVSGVKLPGEVRVVLSGPWPPSEFVQKEHVSEQ